MSVNALVSASARSVLPHFGPVATRLPGAAPGPFSIIPRGNETPSRLWPQVRSSSRNCALL